VAATKVLEAGLRGAVERGRRETAAQLVELVERYGDRTQNRTAMQELVVGLKRLAGEGKGS